VKRWIFGVAATCGVTAAIAVPLLTQTSTPNRGVSKQIVFHPLSAEAVAQRVCKRAGPRLKQCVAFLLRHPQTRPPGVPCHLYPGRNCDTSTLKVGYP